LNGVAYCTVDAAHVYSEQKEALLVAFYHEVGIPVDGYAGCVECGLSKRRASHPRLLAAVEAKQRTE
jgi:hypothetical protein